MIGVTRNRYESFKLRQLKTCKRGLKNLKLSLGVSHNIDKLFEPVRCGKFVIPNHFAVLPMEGCECKSDGSPDEMTFRRYRALQQARRCVMDRSHSGSQKGRANPRQLWIHKEIVALCFKALVKETLEAAKERFGVNIDRYLFCNLRIQAGIANRDANQNR
jgi:hypothetical protein